MSYPEDPPATVYGDTRSASSFVFHAVGLCIPPSSLVTTNRLKVPGGVKNPDNFSRVDIGKARVEQFRHVICLDMILLIDTQNFLNVFFDDSCVQTSATVHRAFNPFANGLVIRSQLFYPFFSDLVNKICQ